MPDSGSDRFIREVCVLAGRFPPLVLVQSMNHDREDIPEPLRGRTVKVGASSSHAIALSCGLASVGKIVVLATDRPDFIGQSWNDIRHTLLQSLQNITVVLLPPSPRSVGPVVSESWSLLRQIPVTEIYVPADVEEMRQALDYCVTRHAPTFIHAPADEIDPAAPAPAFGSARFSPGVWPRLRDGSDLAVITAGDLAAAALHAASRLAAEGIQASVVHASSIQPVDRSALLALVRKIRRVITCERHSVCGGLGSAVAEVLAESGSGAKLVRLGMSDLDPAVSVSAKSILRAAKALLKSEGKRSGS